MSFCSFIWLVIWALFGADKRFVISIFSLSAMILGERQDLFKENIGFFSSICFFPTDKITREPKCKTTEWCIFFAHIVHWLIQCYYKDLVWNFSFQSIKEHSRISLAILICCEILYTLVWSPTKNLWCILSVTYAIWPYPKSAVRIIDMWLQEQYWL